MEDRNQAIKLRNKGYSYTEILKSVNVSKSSLSEWLRHIKITNTQVERLRSKNAKARKLGSITLKRNRIEKTKTIINKAKLEIRNLSINHLKIIGTILYWTEGSKQKKHDPSKELIFSNSDPKMIRIYLLWLKECLLIKPCDIKFEIYIHETYNKTPKELSAYWSKITKFPILSLNKIYFKKNKVNSYRKNMGTNYHGVLRITVRKSTDMNRKVTGWIQGICREFKA